MPSRIHSLIAILCLLAAGTVWSQDTKGTITGRVTDPSGAVIAGAQVVVTNAAMGTKSDLTTNAEGIYRAPALAPGMYQIEVTSQGFKKAIRKDVEVRVADRLDINFALEIGAAEQSVTVSTETAAAQRRIRFAGHRGGRQARRRPAALLRQSLPPDRPDRRRDLQRQRPARSSRSNPPTSSTSRWAEPAAT